MPYRRTPRVEAHLRASRDRILAAALAIVAEHGYAGCSVAAVARRAGVATGSVYRHFPAKADLVAEVFRTASQREVDAFARAASLEGSVAESIAAVIDTFAGRALRAPRLAYALLAEPADPAVDAERLVFRRAYAEVIARIVARGITCGELPPQDVGVSAAALVGAIGEALVGPLAAGAISNTGATCHAGATSEAEAEAAARPAPAAPSGAPFTSVPPLVRTRPSSSAPPPTRPPAPVAPAAPAGPAATGDPADGMAAVAPAARVTAAATAEAASRTIAHLITFAQRSIGAVHDDA